MKIIKQHDSRDCGPACLAMIANHYGMVQPLSVYRELTQATKDGVSIYSIVHAAQKLGISADGLSGSFEDLLVGISSQEIPTPFIAHMINREGQPHFVVVREITDRHILIADPAWGKRKMKHSAFVSQWTGSIVVLKPSADFTPKTVSRERFRMWALLRGQYRRLICVFVLSLLIAAIGITGAFVFKLVINHLPEEEAAISAVAGPDHKHHHELVFSSDDPQLNSVLQALQHTIEQIDGRSLGILFSAIIMLYALASILQYVRGRLLIEISRVIDRSLSLSFFDHLMDLSIPSLGSRQTGDYQSRFSEISAIRNAVSNVALALIFDLVMAAGCSVILYLQNRQMFLVSLVIVFAYALIVICYRGRIERANRKYMVNEAMVQSYLKESLSGIETVKAACAEPEAKQRFSQKVSAQITSVVKKSRIACSQEAFTSGVMYIGGAAVLWAGFSAVISGTLSLGTLITFYVLLDYFMEPIKNLIGLQPALQSAFVAAERLSDIWEIPAEKEAEGSPSQSPDVGRQEDSQQMDIPAVQKWTAANLCFRYGYNDLAVDDVSLTLDRGEKISVIGESGSGKTTLAKLFLRFYDPESGSISADGVSLCNYAPKSVRRAIAYVGQDIFFFAGTIRDNLVLGNPAAGEDEILRACALAKIGDFIQALPFGLDSHLDENGANLSVGQKQRLALARALIQKPQLLILDEATSNLDSVTEAAIRDAIMASDMTCIIIAHRLSTIRACNRIYVMDHGKLIEQGAHDELVAADGAYAAFIRNQ